MKNQTDLRHGRAGRVAGALLGLILATTTIGVAVSPAQALPPGGASSDTPGTSGTVSPRQVKPGGTLSFTIKGFPGGEVVSVKIDDGEFCSAKGVHGACVVHQQKSAKDGSVSGSFVVPSDLAAGEHALRFLASSEMTDDDGNYLGVKPYSLRGDTEFTVAVAGGSGTTGSTSGSTPEQGSGTTASKGSSGDASRSSTGTATGSGAGSTGTTSGSTPADASAGATEPGAADAGEETVPGALRVPAPATSPASPAGDGVLAAEATSAPEAAADVTDAFPWLGVGVLTLCVLLGAGLLLRGRTGRRA